MEYDFRFDDYHPQLKRDTFITQPFDLEPHINLSGSSGLISDLPRSASFHQPPPQHPQHPPTINLTSQLMDIQQHDYLAPNSIVSLTSPGQGLTRETSSSFYPQDTPSAPAAAHSGELRATLLHELAQRSTPTPDSATSESQVSSQAPAPSSSSSTGFGDFQSPPQRLEQQPLEPQREEEQTQEGFEQIPPSRESAQPEAQAPPTAAEQQFVQQMTFLSSPDPQPSQSQEGTRQPHEQGEARVPSPHLQQELKAPKLEDPVNMYTTTATPNPNPYHPPEGAYTTTAPASQGEEGSFDALSLLHTAQQHNSQRTYEDSQLDQTMREFQGVGQQIEKTQQQMDQLQNTSPAIQDFHHHHHHPLHELHHHQLHDLHELQAPPQPMASGELSSRGQVQHMSDSIHQLEMQLGDLAGAAPQFFNAEQPLAQVDPIQSFVTSPHLSQLHQAPRLLTEAEMNIQELISVPTLPLPTLENMPAPNSLEQPRRRSRQEDVTDQDPLTQSTLPRKKRRSHTSTAYRSPSSSPGVQGADHGHSPSSSSYSPSSPESSSNEADDTRDKINQHLELQFAEPAGVQHLRQFQQPQLNYELLPPTSNPPLPSPDPLSLVAAAIAAQAGPQQSLSQAISPSIAAGLHGPTSTAYSEPFQSQQQQDLRQHMHYQQQVGHQFQRHLESLQARQFGEVTTPQLGVSLINQRGDDLTNPTPQPAARQPSSSSSAKAKSRSRRREREKVKQIPLTAEELAELANAPPPEPRKPKRGRRSKHTIQDPNLVELVPKTLKRDTKTKSFVCQIPGCGQFFRRLEHLQRHIMMHTGEKPNKCHLCSKSFSRADNLKQHLLVHQRGGSPTPGGNRRRSITSTE